MAPRPLATASPQAPAAETRALDLPLEKAREKPVALLDMMETDEQVLTLLIFGMEVPSAERGVRCQGGRVRCTRKQEQVLTLLTLGMEVPSVQRGVGRRGVRVEG